MKSKAIVFAIKLLLTLGLFTLLFRPETFGLRPDFWGGDIKWTDAELVEVPEESDTSTTSVFDLGSQLEKNRLKLYALRKTDETEAEIEGSSTGESWENIVPRGNLTDMSRPVKKSRAVTVDLPENEFQFLKVTLHFDAGDGRKPAVKSLKAGVFKKLTLSNLISELRGVETHNLVFWLLFAAVVKLIGMLFGVLRWRLLLHGQGLRIPFWYMVQSWFVGRTIGIFLPGTIGLDGYRLYDSSRYTGEVIKSTTVIAIEKLIGLIAVTLITFITFPMGYHLLEFKTPVLIIFMTVFGGVAVISLLTLLNPRIIQVIVAVVPTPAAVRNKLDKLGAAAAAYGGHKGYLILAVMFGVLVHVGTCLMYFGTMSAIRAENTTIYDIFFASPLMIWGTVLGPTVGGEGIREIVFTICLAAKSGTAKTFLFAHLGWWVGELVPFLIGLPIFLLRSRPSKEQMQEKLAEARKEAAEAEGSAVHLTPKQVGEYRRKLINCALAGILGGLIAGAVIGLSESLWVFKFLEGLPELATFWWGPVVYGAVFAGAGLGIAGALTFLLLLMDKLPSGRSTFALSLAGATAAGFVVIGFFRFKRDVLDGHMPGLVQLLGILAVAAAAGMLLAGAALLLSRVSRSRAYGVVAALAVYALLLLGGFATSLALKPPVQNPVFEPTAKAQGPNVILVAIDALRADYLPMFADGAPAKTPNLQDLANDAIVFKRCFAQASWTKPSFATIFSGLYPESHTATSKMAILPEEVTTFPEVLMESGYYTKGFTNNPNTTSVFNFDQGYVDYVDLKPDLAFGASLSASKLAVYGGLRVGKNKVFSPKIIVTDFYQPAETVTELALDWITDGPDRKDAPFFLYLHYMDPHDPFMDPDSDEGGYARVKMEHPDPDEFQDCMKDAYISEIEYLDEQLGELFKGLKNDGLYDDSLIIFTSDHGEEFFDHDGWWHGQTLYDELIFVPLIVKLPKNMGGGQVNTNFARHVDLAQTVLKAANAEPAPEMAGKALLDLDGTFLNAATNYIYAETDFEGNVLQAVRSADAKIIRANRENHRNLDAVEFYDMLKDPKEQDSIAGQGDPREAELDEIATGMISFIKENAAEPAMVEQLSTQQKEQLEALGYLGN